MNKPQSKQDVGRPFSRYDNKKIQIATGLREPFEFKNLRRSEPDTFDYGETSFRVFKKKPKKAAVKTIVTPAVILSEGRAIATVVGIRPDLWCAFLETSEGQVLYLNFTIAKQFMGEVDIVKGLKIDCRFKHVKNAKHPRVEEIFSVQPKNE